MKLHIYEATQGIGFYRSAKHYDKKLLNEAATRAGKWASMGILTDLERYFVEAVRRISCTWSQSGRCFSGFSQSAGLDNGDVATQRPSDILLQLLLSSLHPQRVMLRDNRYALVARQDRDLHADEQHLDGERVEEHVREERFNVPSGFLRSSISKEMPVAPLPVGDCGLRVMCWCRGGLCPRLCPSGGESG
jgi:hypothetical protein